MAQNIMKQQEEQHHFKHSFAAGDRVFFTSNPINKHHSKEKCLGN